MRWHLSLARSDCAAAVEKLSAVELYKIEHGLGSFPQRERTSKEGTRGERPPKMPEPPVSARRQASSERRRNGSAAANSRGSNGGEVAAPSVATEGGEVYRPRMIGSTDQKKRPAAAKERRQVPKGGAGEHRRRGRWGGGPHQSAAEKRQRLSKVEPPHIHSLFTLIGFSG